jgi:hypothetical protein
MLIDDDYPIGIPPGAFEKFAGRTADEWGTGISLHAFAPSIAGHGSARAAPRG